MPRDASVPFAPSGICIQFGDIEIDALGLELPERLVLFLGLFEGPGDLLLGLLERSPLVP